jgi:hypothetical protein
MYTPTQAQHKFKIRLGTMQDGSPLFLRGFEWECGWYWAGGYLGNKDLHCHFDSCFLECPNSRGHALGAFFDPWTKPPDYIKPESVKRISNGAAVWECVSFFLDDCPAHIVKNWWRIKDLYKQFYAYKAAAECFKHGGHCTGAGRDPAELSEWQAGLINRHIERVIIPNVKNALGIDNGKSN